MTFLQVPAFKGICYEVKNNKKIKDSKKILSPTEDVVELNNITKLLNNTDKVSIVESDNLRTKFKIDLNEGTKTIELYKTPIGDITSYVKDLNKNGYIFELKIKDVLENISIYQDAMKEFLKTLDNVFNQNTK